MFSNLGSWHCTFEEGMRLVGILFLISLFSLPHTITLEHLDNDRKHGGTRSQWRKSTKKRVVDCTGCTISTVGCTPGGRTAARRSGRGSEGGLVLWGRPATGLATKKGSGKGSQKAFREGGFQKVPRTPPRRVRPLLGCVPYTTVLLASSSSNYGLRGKALTI